LNISLFRKLYSQSNSAKERSYLEVIKRMVKATHTKISPQNFSPFFDDKLRLLYADSIEDNADEANASGTSAETSEHVPSLSKSSSAHSFKHPPSLNESRSNSNLTLAGVSTSMMSSSSSSQSKSPTAVTATSLASGSGSSRSERRHKKEKATVKLMNTLTTATIYANKVSENVVASPKHSVEKN